MRCMNDMEMIWREGAMVRHGQSINAKMQKRKMGPPLSPNVVWGKHREWR